MDVFVCFLLRAISILDRAGVCEGKRRQVSREMEHFQQVSNEASYFWGSWDHADDPHHTY